MKLRSRARLHIFVHMHTRVWGVSSVLDYCRISRCQVIDCLALTEVMVGQARLTRRKAWRLRDRFRAKDVFVQVPRDVYDIYA